MSYTEHFSGTLTPIKIKNTLEETAKDIVEFQGDKLETYHNNYIDALNDYQYKEYVVLNDKIYKVEMKEFDGEDDIFESKLNADGSISFELRYYNGGCGFDEAIKEATKNIEIIDKNNIKYKFRAKQIDDGQWVEGDKIECSRKTWIVIDAKLGAKLGVDFIHCEVVEVDKNTLESVNHE